MKKFLLIIYTACFLSLQVSSQPGNLDPNFGSSGLAVNSYQSYITAIAVQPDGKIVATGYAYNGTSFGLAVFRYNTNGSPDITFGVNGKITGDLFSGNDVAIDANGKIVVASGNSNHAAIARFNPNGSPDATFGNNGIVLFDFGRVAHFFTALSIDPNGKIVAAGLAANQFVNSDDLTEKDIAIARVNPDGSYDLSFSGDAKHIEEGNNFEEATSVNISAGKIIVTGQHIVLRYNDNGTPDLSFDGDGKLVPPVVTGIASAMIQADGNIVIGGYNYGPLIVARINSSNGSMDNSFGAGGFVYTNVGGNGVANSVKQQPDGRIVAAGGGDNGGGDRNFVLARYNTDGTPDNSFGSNGKVITSLGLGATILSIAIRNKIIYAGGALGVPDNPVSAPRFFGVLAAYNGAAVRLACPGNTLA
ncbi:MAG TPA: hypothetical protein VK498_07860, partial [Ferruginibacter sp.]|nr:hypothetical protein [Ferruginibacter sp.]